MVNDTIEKEETKLKKPNKKNSKQVQKKKLPKEISQEILKQMFKNLLRAVGIMLYFIVLNLAHSAMNRERLVGDIEVFAGVFLIVGIFFLERAYKKEQGGTAVTGIEFLMLSLHSLSIMHITTLFRYDFKFYLLSSSYVISIYYVLKAIVLYTKGRKEYLNSLSDISEIVKKEKPVKKEAKKRNEEQDTRRISKDMTDGKPIKKKTTSKSATSNIKKKTVKEETKKEQAGKKKTSKVKSKTEKEDKPERIETRKKTTTKAKTKPAGEKLEEAKTEKKTSKTKSKSIKEEKSQEIETEKKNAKTKRKSTKDEKPEESRK